MLVTGELTSREYEKDGTTRSSLELRIDRLDLGPKLSGHAPQSQSQSNAADDEIPF